LTTVFVLGSVVMIRLIDWGGLLQLLHGTPPPLIAEVVPDRSAKAPQRRGPRGVREPQPAGEDAERLASNSSTTGVESVRSLSSRLEELPARGKIDLADGSPSSLPQEAGIFIEQVDTSPTSSSGLLTIKSQAPSRIYIDGQYSGMTPRTVHLLAGEYQVRLVADGYLEWTSRVTVRQQEQVGVVAAMTRIEP
jgi:hypothetical protein